MFLFFFCYFPISSERIVVAVTVEVAVAVAVTSPFVLGNTFFVFLQYMAFVIQMFIVKSAKLVIIWMCASF